jgi:hypothetical protein
MASSFAQQARSGTKLSMFTIIALAIAAMSVLVTFTVGMWGFRSTRALNDLEEARRVLDSAAIKLHETEYALNNCRVGLDEHGASFFNYKHLRAAHIALGDCVKELDALLERLRVRFPSRHLILITFRNADQAAREVHRHLVTLRDDMRR